MKRSRFNEEQIIGILKEHQAGLGAKELCREHGVSDATFYIYGCLSLCKIFADPFRRQVPGSKHLSGVTGRWCAQMEFRVVSLNKWSASAGHYKS